MPNPSPLDQMIMEQASAMDAHSSAPGRPPPSPMVEAMKRASDRVRGLPLSLRFKKGGAMIIANGKF